MKILIITDTATHPVVAGNRARIVALAGVMREMGHRVECQLLPRSVRIYDERAAREFWVDGYHSRYCPPRPGLWKKARYRIQTFFNPRPERMHRPMPAAYGIDDWCRDSWCEEVKEVVKAVQPDAVMVEYVYMSRVLEGVPVSVLKIIDTHDKFTDRAEVYRAQGKEPAFYYTTESEEAEGLRRADRVVAISPEERDFFERISGVSSFYVPHPIEVKDVTEPTGPGVGFLGSSNDVNRIGLDWFLNQVWPGVVGRVPAARLRIAGTICESMAGVSAPSIELVGRVELDEFYGSVSVIVNPLLGGTGQKIKLIEALGYGKAVVTTSSGASGLEGSGFNAFQVVDEPDMFAGHVVQLLEEPKLRQTMVDEGRAFCQSYNETIRRNLEELLAI